MSGFRFANAGCEMCVWNYIIQFQYVIVVFMHIIITVQQWSILKQSPIYYRSIQLYFFCFCTGAVCVTPMLWVSDIRYELWSIVVIAKICMHGSHIGSVIAMFDLRLRHKSYLKIYGYDVNRNWKSTVMFYRSLYCFVILRINIIITTAYRFKSTRWLRYYGFNSTTQPSVMTQGTDIRVKGTADYDKYYCFQLHWW